jgi:hypothetical protein
MAASDAIPVPRKNTAFRMGIDVRNITTYGLITSWTGADSQVSKDGAAYAVCTNEATEIGSSGTGYIEFTASEMNADMVQYRLTLTNTNAETLVITLYPEEAGDYRANTVQVGGTSQTARDLGANLDATVSSRSTYAGGDTSGVTTLLTRLSSVRAGYLDNLSAGAVAQASNLATLAGYVDTEVAAIQADVTTLLTRLSSIRAGYLDNLSAGAVAQASNLATLAGYVDTEVAAILAIATKLDTALELDGAVYRFTLNALELAPSGGSGVADWTADERTAIRTILGIPGSGITPTVPSAGALKVIDDLLDTEVAAIQADVTTLLTRLSSARAGYLDNLSAGAVAQASNLATLAGYVDTEVAAILAIAQKLDTALELDGAVYRFTLNALELAPSGGGGGGVVSGYAAGQDPWTLIAAGIVEGTTSFVASIRNLNGVASGNTVGNGTGTVQMKSLDGAKNRAVGTIDGSGNRTITSRDLT